MKNFSKILLPVSLALMALPMAAETTVKSFSAVTVNFYKNSNISFKEDNREPMAVVSNGLEGALEVKYYAYLPERIMMPESKGCVFKFNFVDENRNPVTITEEGTWNLTINGFYLTNKDGKLTSLIPTLKETYTVDASIAGNDDETAGVGSLNGGKTYNVFTLGGTQVLRNGTSDDVDALDPGIYIINGKKVSLKR